MVELVGGDAVALEADVAGHCAHRVNQAALVGLDLSEIDAFGTAEFEAEQEVAQGIRDPKIAAAFETSAPSCQAQAPASGDFLGFADNVNFDRLI